MATLTPDQLQANTKLNNANNPLYGSAITPSSLAPVTTLQTVPAKADTTNYAGITGGVTQSVIDEYKNLSDTLTQKETNQANEGTAIIDAMKKLTGKTADQQTANETAGVNAETETMRKLTAQLADLNGQASSLNREAQAIPLLTQENNRNTGATDRGVAPQDAGALRLNALKALSIGQQADVASAALTGSQLRLQSAKDKAQQMVDLKYKPLEDDLNIRKEQYELNKDALASIDKKRTEALSVALKKEEQDLADKKDFDKYISDLTTTALASGAPAGVIAAAGKAKTKLEAAQILGKYSPDTLKYELLKEQIKTERAQQSKIYSDIAKTKSETGGNKPLTADEKKVSAANTAIVGLLADYRKEIDGITFLQANSPAKRTAINSLKGRITAEYKQAKQLGTLDAGVQKLIDSIIPDPGNFSISSLNNKAQIKAIDDFSASFGAAPATENNLFSQALGTIPNQSVPGTGSVSGLNKDGSINFKLH